MMSTVVISRYRSHHWKRLDGVCLWGRETYHVQSETKCSAICVVSFLPIRPPEKSSWTLRALAAARSQSVTALRCRSPQELMWPRVCLVREFVLVRWRPKSRASAALRYQGA
ncbi:hypothetical protein Mapa_011618 [Marchantia paleacea]|nr:hypothetical protein Mapa_011618 [Marchantia paleacea]